MRIETARVIGMIVKSAALPSVRSERAGFIRREPLARFAFAILPRGELSAFQIHLTGGVLCIGFGFVSCVAFGRGAVVSVAPVRHLLRLFSLLPEPADLVRRSGYIATIL
jgi:hypothetical protein